MTERGNLDARTYPELALTHRAAYHEHEIHLGPRSGCHHCPEEEARLLQAGDRVTTREGWDGTVTGVDLDDDHRDLGPTFIITADAGHKVRRKSSAVTVTKRGAASDPRAYAGGG